MLIEFPTFSKEQTHAVAYINPEFVSAVLPRMNSMGEYLDGCFVYMVGDDDPVSVNKNIETVAEMIREAQRKGNNRV